MKLALNHITKSFGANRVIDDVTVDFGDLRSLALIGPSGGGKSTLLQLTAGLLEQDTGSINVEGETSPQGRLSRCAMMPQRDLLLPWRTARDNAMIALENRGVSKRDARAKTRPYFEHFGLARFEDVRPDGLSGGMRQRVSFLHTLMAEKDILLLDEPFGALDAQTKLRMQEWLLALWSDFGKTVVFVTHDVEEAIFLSDEVHVMGTRPGRIVETLTVDLPRPRLRACTTTPAFMAMKERCLELLRHDHAVVGQAA